jgi:hypothetical protein
VLVAAQGRAHCNAFSLIHHRGQIEAPLTFRQLSGRPFRPPGRGFFRIPKEFQNIVLVRWRKPELQNQRLL